MILQHDEKQYFVKVIQTKEPQQEVTVQCSNPPFFSIFLHQVLQQNGKQDEQSLGKYYCVSYSSIGIRQTRSVVTDKRTIYRHLKILHLI